MTAETKNHREQIFTIGKFAQRVPHYVTKAERLKSFRFFFQESLNHIFERESREVKTLKYFFFAKSHFSSFVNFL